MKSLPLQVRLLSIFKNLEDDVFASVSRGAIYKTYAKGDVVCNKGDPSNGLFVLIRGELQLYESGREGQEVGLNMIKGPSVFGELGVIDDLPRSADVVALSTTDLAIVPKGLLMSAFAENSSGAKAMFMHLTAMIRRLTHHHSLLVIPSASQRICAMLVDLSEQGRRGDLIEFDMPKQKTLASMVNTTRETVSRTMGQLVSQGVVKKKPKGKLQVVHFEKLKHWAGTE
jgi:CRP-like cAMP-binding protein